VKDRGDDFIVERAGEAVCRIGPINESRRTMADFVSHLSRLPQTDSQFADDLESVVNSQPVEVPKSPWD
jgi:hypothetical protein